MLFNLARMLGPLVSGVLFTLAGRGETGQTAAGVCFLLNGLSFVAVLAALAWMELPPPLPSLHAKPGSKRSTDSTWAGFRYLGRHPRLILLLVLSAAMALFGWPILSLLPAVADQRLSGSTDAYAWMLSAIGGGAGFASLLVASFSSQNAATLVPRRWRRPRVLLFAVPGEARSLPPAVASCALLGCGLILFFPTSQAIMQLNSGDEVRGRVMGIWSMVLCGAHPLGHLLAGRAADRWLNLARSTANWAAGWRCSRVSAAVYRSCWFSWDWALPPRRPLCCCWRAFAIWPVNPGYGDNRPCVVPALARGPASATPPRHRARFVRHPRPPTAPCGYL